MTERLGIDDQPEITEQYRKDIAAIEQAKREVWIHLNSPPDKIAQQYELELRDLLGEAALGPVADNEIEV